MVIPLMLRCFQIVKSSYLIIYIRYLRYTSHVVGTEYNVEGIPIGFCRRGKRREADGKQLPGVLVCVPNWGPSYRLKSLPNRDDLCSMKP